MMIRFMAMFLALVIQIQSHADDSCKHDELNFRCVKVLRVYDGDTVFVDVPDIHTLFGKNIGVRVRGLDTAEVSTKNACEKRVGLYTKEQVVSLIKKAKRVDLVNVSREKYFRILADVTGSIVCAEAVIEYARSIKPTLEMKMFERRIGGP